MDTTQTKEHLIDSLRDELYKKHSWTGETAVKFMVPIILAIRHKDSQALAANTPEDDAIQWALMELRTGGKRELDDTLTRVKVEYRGVSDLLQETLDSMIHFVTRQPDGIIFDIFDYLDRNRPLLRALRDDDFIGSLFERSVSDAFRGDDGRFFTPRNVILIVREMMRLLEHKMEPNRGMSDYTVCDPCCGSARFLIYWSEYIKEEIEERLQQQRPIVLRSELLIKLREKAQRTLFGADLHEDTAAYGCLNMLLHGDGATNIVNLDSLDHFGFFANMPLLRRFAEEFETSWVRYNSGPARQRDDISPYLDLIEEKRAVIGDLVSVDLIDLSDPKWLHVMEVIRALLQADRRYPTEWDSIRAIQQGFRRQAVCEMMIDEWASRNPDVAHGFDVLITNPPFGRKRELQIDDPWILSQYRLATELWVQDMSKGVTENLLARTLASSNGLTAFYIDLVAEQWGKEFVEPEDQVSFEKLSSEILAELLEHRDVRPTEQVDYDTIVQKLRRRLRRAVNERLRQDRSLVDRDTQAGSERDAQLKQEAKSQLKKIEKMTYDELVREMSVQELGWADILLKRELVNVLTHSVGRDCVDTEDRLLLSDLPGSEAVRVCSAYLYDGGTKPNEVLANKIVDHFGKEWLTVEDIEGPTGFASKVTLLFNGEPHTIYYDDSEHPIVYKKPVPKQVLFVEQFLRMVRAGGKVFTVLDAGVLNNVGDEYVRQFIHKNAWVHAIVEFPHGAFKAAEANVKTAIMLYEKKGIRSENPAIVLSLPQYLGFRLNDQSVPCIQENDLGKVLCDYSVALGLGTLYPHCDTANSDSDGPYCSWQSKRTCDYWAREVSPETGECPSERQTREFDILSSLSSLSRTSAEQRMDPKFYVLELRFERLAEHLSRDDVEVRTIEQIAREPIHRGCQPEYNDLEGAIPVLKTVDVQNRKINWEDCRRVTAEFHDSQPSAQITCGDIVLTSTGEGSWGRAAICDTEKALADGHLTILKINTDVVDPYAVLAFLWSEYGFMQFEQRVRGSTGQTEIYPQDIETIKILIPTENERQQIVQKVRKQFRLLDDAKQLYQEIIQDVESLLGGAE